MLRKKTKKSNAGVSGRVGVWDVEPLQTIDMHQILENPKKHYFLFLDFNVKTSKSQQNMINLLEAFQSDNPNSSLVIKCGLEKKDKWREISSEWAHLIVDQMFSLIVRNEQFAELSIC